MALVIVTGLPASGKSSRSRELYEYLQPRLGEISEKSQGTLKGRILGVRIVSEHDFDQDREIYRGWLADLVGFVVADPNLRHTPREASERCDIRCSGALLG